MMNGSLPEAFRVIKNIGDPPEFYKVTPRMRRIFASPLKTGAESGAAARPREH